MNKKNIIKVENLTISYGENVLLSNINFEIQEKDIFIIMGPSGCGKTTLLNTLTGLKTPSSGKIFVDRFDFLSCSEKKKDLIMKKCGILYQSGALFSSMTIEENVALPLQQWTNYSTNEIKDLVDLKLSFVGLSGFEKFYPSEISGGMKKRAGFARALALDPQIVYFDEPSAGLDPINSKKLDELILQINENLGTTIVIITHELNSIFNIGTNSIFLDDETKKIIGYGKPAELLKNTKNKKIIDFLSGGRFYAKNT